MKTIVSVLISLGVQFLACAQIEMGITNVTSHQRYPWNGKVDIDFTIKCWIEEPERLLDN